MTRVQIIDFNPLAYKYIHGAAPLSHQVRFPNGEVKEINTTIQNGVFKAINRWSKEGRFPTAVCFDAPTPTRKQFFQKTVMGDSGETYKGGRRSAGGPMLESMNITKEMLHKSGVSCYQINNYEADDLIFSVVQSSKLQYGPNVPIDVITNDQDLLPLVDDQVSVWIRSMKGTFAEDKDLEKAKYIQVTPRNYQEVIEDLSAFRGMYVPYNTILLYKILRGDPSDNIPGYKRAFPPRKVRAMLEAWEEEGIDLGNVFRYGRSDEYFPIIRELIAPYCDGDEELLNNVMKNYWGMNLNANYNAVGSAPSRSSIATLPPKSFNAASLAETALSLGINIPLGRYY